MSSANRRVAQLKVAAGIYGVCTKTLRRRIADGSITGYRFGPKLIYVDLDEIDRFMGLPGGAA